jgi:hypothetical protein
MDLNQVIRILNTFTDDDLTALNRAVVTQIKTRRSAVSAINRHLFKAGDVVKWSGRNGPSKGTIIRVKQKKAIVDAGPGRNWDIPLAMLSAA